MDQAASTAGGTRSRAALGGVGSKGEYKKSEELSRGGSQNAGAVKGDGDGVLEIGG